MGVGRGGRLARVRQRHPGRAWRRLIGENPLHRASIAQVYRRAHGGTGSPARVRGGVISARGHRPVGHSRAKSLARCRYTKLLAVSCAIAIVLADGLQHRRAVQAAQNLLDRGYTAGPSGGGRPKTHWPRLREAFGYGRRDRRALVHGRREFAFFYLAAAGGALQWRGPSRPYQPPFSTWSPLTPMDPRPVVGKQAKRAPWLRRKASFQDSVGLLAARRSAPAPVHRRSPPRRRGRG